MKQSALKQSIEKQSILTAVTFTFILALFSACSSDNVLDGVINSVESELPPDIPLITFEDNAIPSLIEFTHAKGTLVSNNAGVTEGKKALQVRLKSKENYKSEFILRPQQAWNWSANKNFSVGLDITNPGEMSTHLFATVYDIAGQVHTRSVSVPMSSSNTYYIELSGLDLNVDSGIRSNPKSWKTSTQAILWRWGTKNLDLKGIEKIVFSVVSLLEDRELIIDNIRLINNPDYDEQYLRGFVDQFGQNTQVSYDTKISSLADLKRRTRDELSGLSGQAMQDRSTYGGWKNGPRLEAKGYFTTAKVDGRWSLVDPEGYLFFSTGIANVRMANTSTMTGIDFEKSRIKQRDPGDVTPEDSIGLNPVSSEAQKTRFTASSLRRNMFTWLPAYDDDLANHYGYRREVHSGPLESGETFSFYRANLERKYGETKPESFMDDWRKVTIDRMLDWGFTSFGNWLAPEFYHMDRIPYFANGWIIGDFKKVSSGADYWKPLPDPFDPLFTERALVTAKVIADEVADSRWCVGIFIDNEKSWGQVGSPESHYGVVIHTLNRDAKESPTKAVFTRLMREKYKEIAKLNAQWNSNIASWEAFGKGVASTQYTDAQLEDYSLMLETYASEYFRIVDSTLDKVLPNHMYMGVRFADWGMTPEIVRAAARYVDVMSYNLYKEGLHPKSWSFLAEVDKPSIIGEFHFGATDSGLLNPGVTHTASQADRATKFINYMHSVIDNPYFVGAHWFQYIDSPLTGRALDGENYNIGFVSVSDTPYEEMVNAAKEINSNLYTRRFGAPAKK